MVKGKITMRGKSTGIAPTAPFPDPLTIDLFINHLKVTVQIGKKRLATSDFLTTNFLENLH